MPIVAKRRLRVRDDGSGERRELDATFAEFADAGAIVLLGDPGLGKTTLFKEEAHGHYVTVRNFLIDPSAAAAQSIFLDGLDEYRTLANGADACAEVAKTLCALNKPKFRLSCRAADWFGSSDQDALTVASPSGRVVVLQLFPLSRDEILFAVNGLVPDPAKFLEEAEAAGLGGLLGNPQTLDLIVRAWSSGKKPRNRFEAYEIGIAELLKESNVLHAVRGSASPDPSNLRKAAGAIASTLLLSNSTGISRAETAEGSGYVGLSVIPHPDKEDIDTALKRRLFTSSDSDRFELAHRTIAEFLATEDLLARIKGGLPIDRVMGLICGADGAPVSSLRGLFAWLMCKLGHIAEAYVRRDPYGVATYGDASVLLPKAQCAIWNGLRALQDPWFLANEDERGSFRGLANPDTASVIREILGDNSASIHLRIAVLESVANSTSDIGMGAIMRDLVLTKTDNTWLRTAALKAYATCVKQNWVDLDILDRDLATAAGDIAAPEVRVALLELTKNSGNLPDRLLSIMAQAVSFQNVRRAMGHFYRLHDFPADADLDALLDGASRVLISENHEIFEFESLFDGWLKRRLENDCPIPAARLAHWLPDIKFHRDPDRVNVRDALKARFEREIGLFEATYDRLSTEMPNTDHSFRVFLFRDLWQALPPIVWPVPHAAFFLSRAEKETDPSRAAELFQTYLSWFPTEGGSVELAEAGFSFLDRREDVALAVTGWNVCQIADGRLEQFEKREQRARDKAVERERNIAYLIPRLSILRDGRDENSLVWALQVYVGLAYGVQNSLEPRGRLVSVTNEEIADVIIEGFTNYAVSPDIPTEDQIAESLSANSIPFTHMLLALSVFMRYRAGLTIPEAALRHCLAAAVTQMHTSLEVPRFDKGLQEWFVRQARDQPHVLSAILRKMWLVSVAKNNPHFPGFYELREDPGSAQFLASLSAEILETGINENPGAVSRFLSVLMAHDHQAALAIGEGQIGRAELSAEVRAIWAAVLFALDSEKHLGCWKALASETETALWEAIEVIAGREREKIQPPGLTAAQRAEVVNLVGKRFPSAAHPMGGWGGSRNTWDASEFIGNQIGLLAADESKDAGALLTSLADNNDLASYHDQIRHRLSQRTKRQRETSFTFASSSEVANAIRNLAPATPNDLVAYVVDHLNILARELRTTQTERYRAYWNQNGRALAEPKREEDCSGFLAEDLQHRIQAHNLIVTVEHHMVADKECDLVVLQGTERLLPIEAKHHYHAELWTAWRTQLDRLYTRDAKAGGLGIYVVFWSGEATGRKMPKLPEGIERPSNADALKRALEALIPTSDRHRLRIIVVDISPPGTIA